MKKKYLGIISIIYASLIIYLKVSDKLKIYLSSTLQGYLIISIFPLLVGGLILFFSKKDKHKIKPIDILLLLPLIMILIIGDSTLGITIASNRNINSNYKIKHEIEKSNEIPSIEEENSIEYDLTDIYFELEDANYIELSSYLTFEEKKDKYIGKLIKLRGFTLTKASYLKQGYFAIGKYEISCCAADASFAGFIAKYDLSKVKENRWYEVIGVLKKGTDKYKNDILYIEVLDMKLISSKDEEIYVYPCYRYSDDACEAIYKYDLEY